MRSLELDSARFEQVVLGDAELTASLDTGLAAEVSMDSWDAVRPVVQEVMD
ncbi:MAG TPA: hypothetical protein VFE45_17095 [Coriobacteriia bacterium]|nr:hypothetical protein [Coriobacteriia bacterium]